MNDTLLTNKTLSFKDWATRVSVENRDTLESMLKSSDVLDRVIAKRVLIAGGTRE
jgi:threonine synthase